MDTWKMPDYTRVRHNKCRCGSKMELTQGRMVDDIFNHPFYTCPDCGSVKEQHYKNGYLQWLYKEGN